MREDFIEGRFKLRIEPTTLRLRDYRQFLLDNQQAIASFKIQQQAAFEAERQRWLEAGQLNIESEVASAAAPVINDVPSGCIGIASPVTGSVWQLSAQVGAMLNVDSELLVVEAMKMEIPVTVDEVCELVELRCNKGQAVTAGEIIAVIRPGATQHV
jgi:urea carboxylase